MKKMMMEKIKECIDKNENFLILPHKNPDGDTLGSAYALFHILSNLNKNGYIILEDNIPFNLSFLSIEYYTIEEFNELEIDYEYVFTLDSSDRSRFDNRENLVKDKKIINIDHHKTNTNYGLINYVKEASSVGEILYDMFKAFNYEINKEVATGIFIAISTDTGSFKYSNTTKNTFRVMSEIRPLIDYNKLNVELYQNILLDKLVLENKIMSTLKIYENVGVIYFTEDMKKSFRDIDTDGLVEKIRNISSVKIAIFLKAIDDKSYKVSLRSKGKYDVAKLALEYDGGGHSKAAGCKIEGVLDNIIEMLINKIIGG